MALDRARLATSIFNGLRALYNYDNLLDNDRDPEYTLRRWSEIISNSVIDEFVANAQCQGEDSHGDSHGNVGII